MIENPLNESSFAFPVLEWIHVFGMVCALGTVAAMNLRLLGVGMKSGPAKFWRETWLVTLFGLAIAITSGLLLFTIAPEEYAPNQIFQLKMVLLVAAIVFYYTVVRRAAGRDRGASIVAVISLVLFALVPLGGVFMGIE